MIKFNEQKSNSMNINQTQGLREAQTPELKIGH